MNGAGKRETKPILIWTPQNPSCFKGMKKSTLPVEYFSQPKTWTTGNILDTILSKINLFTSAENKEWLVQ